ncbi:MAG TPA: glycosyltransferase family 4 protein [Patescibacteria group bacterium]|uniref:Glycosyl transferase family 1 domain-containing protein n=1 Tax=Candidatus Woesebacteria bacterium RBG_13_46_13 TaxID=1802479 RepID=A0A1F7X3C6_9BACT|nr:MAG: hypothetical protein A2Y68_00220 [Candidatus Woesebacteria bacterium RBG_13_46_13]HJX58993.1 glycosyltransferase family 4 protein [Patescibacteria group bacterium]
MKVLLLNPTIPPRAIPILKDLSREPGIDLMVFFYSISAKNRRWQVNRKTIKFKYQILKSFDIPFGKNDYIPFTVSFNFLKKLLISKPNVVIAPGWADFPSYVSAIYCKLFGKKLILRSESTVYEDNWRRKVFMPLTKFMVNCADAYIAAGTRAKNYLVKLGAKKEKIFVGYSAIDVKLFSLVSKASWAEKVALRKKLGIGPKDRVVMFNGQLIIRKGVYDLLEAFKKILLSFPNATLLMVGYGMEMLGIEKYIRDNRLTKKVILTGFVDNKLLPKYYGISDIFVLPSREETWGMVINEAMASGLPVITGDKVGAGADLIKSGVNGYIFPSGNINKMVTAIEKLLKDRSKRVRFGMESRRIINSFGIDQLVEAILKSIYSVRQKED